MSTESPSGDVSPDHPDPASTVEGLENCRHCGQENYLTSRGIACPYCNRREIRCEGCRKPVSDVAETCPSCGHPQPKKLVTDEHPAGKCGVCGTFNLIFPYNQEQGCRGCKAQLETSCSQPYLEYEALRVYENAEDVLEWPAPVAAGAVLVVVWLVWGSKTNFESLALAWIPSLAVYALTRYVVRQIVFKNGFLNGFNTSCRYADKMRLWPIDSGYWATAESKYKKKHPGFWTPIKVITVAALTIGIGSSISQALKEDSKKKEAEKLAKEREELEKQRAKERVELEKRRQQEESIIKGDLLTSNLTVSSSFGFSNTDLKITNKAEPHTELIRNVSTLVTPEALSKCDLTITVTFENGVVTEFKRVWETWGVGEVKVVTFPNQGRLRKVEVKGVLNTVAGREGIADSSFTFKSK